MASNFDASKIVTDWDGKPVKVQKDTTLKNDREFLHPAEDLSLGYAACDALSQSYESEKGLSPDEKFKRFALGMKISGANGLPVELSTEEAATLKKVAGLRYGPLVMGKIWEEIDPPKAAA